LTSLPSRRLFLPCSSCSVARSPRPPPCPPPACPRPPTPRSLFSCCAAPRDLHSFPTRRSSDLGRYTCVPLLKHLADLGRDREAADRKSTRLNSSHVSMSYAVFCLKKKSPKLSTPSVPPFSRTATAWLSLPGSTVITTAKQGSNC